MTPAEISRSIAGKVEPVEAGTREISAVLSGWIRSLRRGSGLFDEARATETGGSIASGVVSFFGHKHKSPRRLLAISCLVPPIFL